MLSGLFRYGMARNFRKNHHPNATLKTHRTQKAGPLVKPFGKEEWREAVEIKGNTVLA